MSSTTEQIKDRLSIVDVVGAYIKLEKAGANYKARCPFHNEKTPSFFISPARNSYYCFGCGEKGDIFSFVEKFEGLDFPGALKVLAEKAGVEITRENKQAKTERDRLFAIHDDAAAFFQAELKKNREALEYLEKRGLKSDLIELWQIGFAPDSWTALKSHLTEKNYALSEIQKAGLIKPSEKRQGDHYDRFRSRIIFPIFDPSGRVIAFSGRIFGKEDDAKYLNSPETPLFDKSRTLYGFHAAKSAIRQRDYSILVEGQLDLLMSHQAGFSQTVATSGTAVTLSHLESLKKISPRLIIAYDADKAGIAASERAWQAALGLGMEIKICRLPKGKDPADILKESPALFAEALKNSKHIIDITLHDMLAQNLDHRTLGKRIGEKVLPYIAALESTIEQAHYISNISSLASIPEGALKDELNKIQRKGAQPGAASASSAALRSEALVAGNPEKVKSDPVARKLFALLYWYENQTHKDTDLLREKIMSILGKDKYDSLGKDHEAKKEEILFEAEASFEDGPRLLEERDELLSRLEDDMLREELGKAIQELQKAERDKDMEKTVELLKKCQDISYKLRTLSKKTNE